jgi:hypothetical protein
MLQISHDVLDTIPNHDLLSKAPDSDNVTTFQPWLNGIIKLVAASPTNVGNVAGLQPSRAKPGHRRAVWEAKYSTLVSCSCAATPRTIMPLCWKRRPRSNRLSKLANLPQELQIEILSHLDPVALARCAMVRIRSCCLQNRGTSLARRDPPQTCRSLRDTVQGTSVLVCAVQLHLDGLERGGAPTGHADVLAAIARRRQAWRALDGTEPLARETYHGSRAELVGGAWASMSKHRLEVVWLPAAGDVEDRRLQVRFVDVAAREFTMDPTQDLLVFLENRRCVLGVSSFG